MKFTLIKSFIIIFTSTNDSTGSSYMTAQKAISYSLFGYNKPRHESCFDFNSYIRSMMINIRMNRLIFPDWTIIVHTDTDTFMAYEPIFKRSGILYTICEPAPLCKAMLWRLKPSFEMGDTGNHKYTHVLCRDLDSPATYRELQAVKYWMMKDKAMHAITDSVSHDLPLLGGMIGVRPCYFNMRMQADTWDDMMGIGASIDFTKKGSDQLFLNRFVYPKFAEKGTDSITQHYFNGYPNTFLGDYHTCSCSPTAGHQPHCPNNFEVDLPYEFADSNTVCGHIGAAGYYEGAMFAFLRRYWDRFGDLLEVERLYPNIFYWAA